MLEIKDLHVSYGAIKALTGVSLTVNDGELVTLIGANGAGKTTTLHTISGLLKANSGTITLDGTDLKKVPSHEIIKLGMAQVSEGRHVFAQMTVLENLYMGAYIMKDKAKTEQNIEWVYNHFPRLKERSKQLAGTLSGGEQQMLAIARALMSRPEIIMMDEPSLGLAPIVVRDVFDIIREINKQGKTILLVEQNAETALKIAHRAYVMENGAIALSGTGAEIAQSDSVKEAYLGG